MGRDLFRSDSQKAESYLNGFEVTEEVFKADETIKREFVASQTEYAKTLCAAVMKNINVTQEHDAVISRCTERMYEKSSGRDD